MSPGPLIPLQYPMPVLLSTHSYPRLSSPAPFSSLVQSAQAEKQLRIGAPDRISIPSLLREFSATAPKSPTKSFFTEVNEVNEGDTNRAWDNFEAGPSFVTFCKKNLRLGGGCQSQIWV